MKILFIKKRDLAKCVALALILAVSIFAVVSTDSAKVYSNQTVRSLPIYSVDTQDMVCSISFDASWGADSTLGILDVLESHDVVANYFVVGSWAEKYSEELLTLSNSGRVEVGTHSNTHPHMNSLSEDEIKLELDTSVSIIEGITSREVELFRAPFGEYSDTLLSVASSLGLYTIQWDVDTHDWMEISSYEITNRVMSMVTNGSIILMHNDGENTLEALPSIIEGLKNKGYTLVTIGDLIYKDNYTIDHTGKQKLKEV